METFFSTVWSTIRDFILSLYQKIVKWGFVTTPFSQPLVRSYLFLRRGIGIIGVSLPVVLVLATMLLNLSFIVSDSMSSYYYTALGSVFVGSLWAIGIFLISYQYDPLDNIVSTFAGVCAIGLSLFPTPPDCPLTNLTCDTELQKKIGVVHTLFATGFLLALAFMVFFLFTRGDPKDEATEADRARKQRNNILYRVCGIVMAACILLAGLILLVPYLSDDDWHKQVHPILIIEFVSTEAFGVAWFVKGQTLDMLISAIQQLPFIGRGKSDQSAEPSLPAVEQPDGFPEAPFQPTVD